MSEPIAEPPPKLRVLELPRIAHRGHLGMAERFVEDHGDQLRHVHGIGWHYWDGARWKLDEERVDVEAAIDTTKKALAAVVSMAKTPERDALYTDVRKSESASGIEGMLKLAGALKPISAPSRALDADPYLFNTPDGTVDLSEGTIKENDRADLITKVAGAPVGEEPNDEFTLFLERILPDPEVRAFVQRLFGYAMLGKQTEHVMPIFTGTGANGKAPCATPSPPRSGTTASRSIPPCSWSPSTRSTAPSRCGSAAPGSRSAARRRRAASSPKPP